MNDPVYSLTRLAQITGHGRTLLRTMINNGELVAQRCSDGRQEWVVAHSAAVAAGLNMSRAGTCDGRDTRAARENARTEPTVDAALAKLLDTALAPMTARLDEIQARQRDIFVTLQTMRREFDRVDVKQPVLDRTLWTNVRSFLRGFARHVRWGVSSR